MTQAIINPQPYYPQIDKSVDPKVTVHLQRLYPAINDHDQAIVDLKTQLDNVVSGTTVIKNTTTVTGSGSSTVAGVSSFNALIGAVTFFPNLGMLNNQTGVTAYTTLPSDSGQYILLSDASPIAITLQSAPAIQVPWYAVFVNLGAGTATLTPTSGTISYPNHSAAGSMPVPPGDVVIAVFDGTNFSALTIPVPPVNTPAVTHEFLTAYNSQTGVFTAAQPAFTDISGVAAPSQLPTPTVSTLGGVEAIAPVAHEWINQIDTSGVPHLSQPVVADVTGAAPIASPTFTGTVTQPDATVLTAATTATSATAGAASALPALPLGYLQMSVNGVLVKVPYYSV